MAIAHIATTAELRALRLLGAVDSWELIDRLEQPHGRDERFDASVVFELAERVIETEHPESYENIYVEDGRVVHVS